MSGNPTAPVLFETKDLCKSFGQLQVLKNINEIKIVKVYYLKKKIKKYIMQKTDISYFL